MQLVKLTLHVAIFIHQFHHFYNTFKSQIIRFNRNPSGNSVALNSHSLAFPGLYKVCGLHIGATRLLAETEFSWKNTIGSALTKKLLALPLPQNDLHLLPIFHRLPSNALSQHGAKQICQLQIWPQQLILQLLRQPSEHVLCDSQ
jgi:hypothetical protein